MPSTPSPRLRAELQALGENLSTWGDTRLNEALKRLEEGIAQVFTKAVTGNYTLVSANYIADEARAAVLVLTGTPSATYKITIPGVQKTYFVANNTNADQTIGTAGGSLGTVRTGQFTIVYCDGTNTYAADPTLDQIKAPAATVDIANQWLDRVKAGTQPGHAINYTQLQAVYAYAAGIANSGILAPGTVDGKFLQWSAALQWHEASIPPLVAGSGTTVTGSFDAGTMAVNVDSGTGANKVVKRDANARIANLVGLWTTKTTTYTAINGDQLLADTSGGAFTITLPATPAKDDQVVIARIGASNLTIGRNGSTISGAAENLTLDSNYALVTLVCTGANAWRAIPGQFR